MGCSDMFNMHSEASSIDVGKRLRELRDERNVSLRFLARSSGLSANALSMIERGLTSPSVSTLNKLAGALGVPVTAFFRTDPKQRDVVFCKASERARVPFLRGLWEGLGGEFYSGHIEAYMLTLENGGSSGLHSMMHTGSEFVFCLRGTLEYLIESERYLLEAGDSLIFDAHLRHRWRNPGNMVMSAIILISSFEGQEHPGEFHIAASEIVPGDENPAEV